jgi:2-polyprenyl-3-methyl-5-hydroxy-6-metoxy-1,4-benzoquinol methylase
MSGDYQPEQYWNNVAKTIATRSGNNIIAGDDEPYYVYKRNRFLSLFTKINFTGQKVLEVGCGPGGNLAIAAAAQPAELHGADLSPEMLALARERLKEQAVTLTLTNGSDLPYPNACFSIVYTSTVLQHITSEPVLKTLIASITRVSNRDIYIFERIEKKIKGHESNLGRPVSYYAALFGAHGFELTETRFLPIQASYYICGAIRKIFNPRHRKEGEPLSRFSILLEKIFLPITSLLDRFIPSQREVAMLKFEKR